MAELYAHPYPIVYFTTGTLEAEMVEETASLRIQDVSIKVYLRVPERQGSRDGLVRRPSGNSEP